MKQRFMERTGKRLLGIFLTVVMVLSSLAIPQTTEKAYAAELDRIAEKRRIGPVADVIREESACHGGDVCKSGGDEQQSSGALAEVGDARGDQSYDEDRDEEAQEVAEERVEGQEYPHGPVRHEE